MSKRDSQFFFIQVDETTDSSEKAQYSTIRPFVNTNTKIEEHFIGFYNFARIKSAKKIMLVTYQTIQF